MSALNESGQAKVLEYLCDIKNTCLKFKTEDIAKQVGLPVSHIKRYLIPEVWEYVRDERRKQYAKLLPLIKRKSQVR